MGEPGTIFYSYTPFSVSFHEKLKYKQGEKLQDNERASERAAQ